MTALDGSKARKIPGYDMMLTIPVDASNASQMNVTSGLSAKIAISRIVYDSPGAKMYARNEVPKDCNRKTKTRKA